jgi:hypothetical protein
MRGRAVVDAGICGFDTRVVAEAQDPFGKARVSLETACPNLVKMGDVFEVDIMDIVQKGCRSQSFDKLTEVVPVMHCPCPVTGAIFQSVKIAAGLQLPKDIHVELTKEE